MTIRLAMQKDIPGMLRLLKQVGQVHRNIRPDIFRENAQKYDRAALLALLKDPLRPIFIAGENDRVLGYCFCVHKSCKDNPVLLDRSELYIDDLCVEEDSRGTGIATALYDYVRGYAKVSGCNVITLNVWCGNEGAMRFYEKMGMKQRNITMEFPL